MLGVFLLLALLEVPQSLPGGWHVALLLAFAVALAVALWHGFRSFVPPGPAEAERRLERASGLRHRPLSTLSDRVSGNDPMSLALWRAHQRRAAAQLRALRVGAPRPGLAKRDPRALRAGLLVALLAALVVAGADGPERLRRGLNPAFAAGPAPAALRLEAWVTPPDYTGAPPVFLDAKDTAARVPAGSRLQIALSGGAGGVPEMALDGTATPFATLDRGSYTAESVLTEGGRLVIRRDGREIAAWSLSVQGDSPPRVAFQEPPARASRGLGTRLPWRLQDDWGVVALRAEIRLRARPEAPSHVLELPLPSASVRQAEGVAQPDLSAHPWAGLEAEVRLAARDGAGQEGQSETAMLTLPERSFNHPVARALIAVRKALSLDPDAREPARGELDRISAAPEAFEHDTTTFLALRSARHRLAQDRKPEAVPEVQAILWEVALALEEGRTDRTARALEAAREALQDALDQAERDGQASPEERAEIQRRIEDLREAIRRHLEALAERLQRENAEALPFDPQQRLMDQRELDRRTRRMEEAAREGRTEDARRELAELEEMLRALEEGRVARGEDRQRQQQRQRGRQQMGALQDMVRRQGDMLDRSHQRADELEQERRRQRQDLRQQRPWTQPQTPPQQAEPDPQAQEESTQDARRQRALRRALGELMQQFGDLTGEIPDQLGRADQAMREADEQLRAGSDARDAQQRAIRALQEGGRQMAQQMQRQFGLGQDGEEGDPQDMAGDGQQGGQGDQAQQQGSGRDPLGRATREDVGGQDSGSDTRVPDEAEILRTRRIQEELRRRGAEKERPPAELDYIDRLLRRF